VGAVNDDVTLQNARESIVRRANKCIEVGGGLFELLLQKNKSSNLIYVYSASVTEKIFSCATDHFPFNLYRAI
jgi:hypothetical protein